jgi:hypothetical protein
LISLKFRLQDNRNTLWALVLVLGSITIDTGIAASFEKA